MALAISSRGADALHRHHVREPVRAIRLAARGVNFGIDQAGPDRRDANALARDLVAKPDGEGIDRALGRRVIDIGVGRAELGRDRRQIDDDAALAAVPRRHPLHRLARAEDAAGDVDRHHALDALGGHLVDPRRRPDDAGIVDERAQRSELVGGLEQREDVASRSPTSHFTAIALPFLASIAATTLCAAASLLA